MMESNLSVLPGCNPVAVGVEGKKKKWNLLVLQKQKKGKSNLEVDP